MHGLVVSGEPGWWFMEFAADFMCHIGQGLSVADTGSLWLYVCFWVFKTIFPNVLKLAR